MPTPTHTERAAAQAAMMIACVRSFVRGRGIYVVQRFVRSYTNEPKRTNEARTHNV